MLRRIASSLSHNAVAWIALFIACGGTSLAASRYLITSTAQIKPSVLKELRGNQHAVVAALSKKGVHGVVAKARSIGPIAAGTEPANDPMTGATWTQHPEEDNLVIGQATVTRISETQCGGGGSIFVDVNIDGGRISGTALAGTVTGDGEPTTETFPVIWDRSMVASLFEPGQATAHTITVDAFDGCKSEHFKVDSVSLDVMGVY